MNSKGHLYTSLVKSIIRLVGAGLAALFVTQDMTKTSIVCLAASLFLAEILGIAEELLDNRD